MNKRLTLHSMLVSALGNSNVYFQPPESVKINYPCIIYSKDYIATKFADNNPYFNEKRYKIILIEKDPDSSILDDVLLLNKCVFDRYYISNNMHHNVFTIYF